MRGYDRRIELHWRRQSPIPTRDCRCSLDVSVQNHKSRKSINITKARRKYMRMYICSVCNTTRRRIDHSPRRTTTDVRVVLTRLTFGPERIPGGGTDGVLYLSRRKTADNMVRDHEKIHRYITEGPERRMETFIRSLVAKTMTK